MLKRLAQFSYVIATLLAASYVAIRFFDAGIDIVVEEINDANTSGVMIAWGMLQAFIVAPFFAVIIMMASAELANRYGVFGITQKNISSGDRPSAKSSDLPWNRLMQDQ